MSFSEEMTPLYAGRAEFLLATEFEMPPLPCLFELFDPNLKSKRVQIRHKEVRF